jgi:hypothetical protein
MKKLLTILLLFIAFRSSAQWTTGSSPQAHFAPSYTTLRFPFTSKTPVYVYTKAQIDSINAIGIYFVSTDFYGLGTAVSPIGIDSTNWQHTLIAGTNITITGRTISASGGGGGAGTVTSFSFTNGAGFTGTVTNSTTTPTLSLVLQNSSTSQSGQLTSTDWNTFNGKQGALTLTTTGTSGAATLIGNTLNIPQYSGTLTTSNFIFNEIPSGTINGSNVTFTLANTPTTGTVTLYKNGLRLKPTTDYTLSGATITYTVPPSSTGFNDVLLADYLK